ncbi:alpha/beta-type small acid-soluble spore protein [Clostridium niameyense]|uniref:alpha/beta-type small acid-soluble spore protein n=1 Tax=Clostridium niameyense TaxID=1622073 RepID=UPI00067E8A0C|nr:alpha/beta-type small acid-soluble spore protein [Clostridium niameyense]
MANSNSNSNKLVVPEAKKRLEQLKMESANELGLTNYETVDKGNLTARQNGYVGGTMTKKMVEAYEKGLSQK